MPRPIRVRMLLGALTLLIGVAGLTAFTAVDGLRWRAELILLKAAGKIPELAWSELARMIEPGGPVYLEPLIRTRNPFQSIRNPLTSPADTSAGRAEFQIRCAQCHGPEARGGKAPALVGRTLVQGASDWALFRTLTGGLPAGGMPRQPMPERVRWQIIGYLQALRVRGGIAIPGAGMPPFSPVPASRLEAARATPGDWLTYSGAYDGWRHSSLDQITRDNVSGLRLLWIYQSADRETRMETSPIAVGGMLFLTSPTDAVQALDAATGELRWSWQKELPDRLALCCGRVNRGLALLDSTLYLATLDAHLVALDARTGAVRWDVEVAPSTEGFSLTAAPLAVGDLIVVGTAGGEFASRGHIDAYDARSGVRRWRFYTIPPAGEPGNDTWSGDSWRTGGGPAWLTGSYDPALGLLYWGTGNPNPDYDGDTRRGDNLYTNSVVALEAATGRLRWHFQFTPHDEHDWDAVQIPLLVDEPGGGRPLLLWANRNGFYYVLDRRTGAFLRGRPFGTVTWASGLDSAGRPILNPAAVPSRRGTLVFPGSVGATNWWSPSYSPETGTVYVPAFERPDVFFKGHGEEDNRMNTRLGGAPVEAVSGSGRVSVKALDAMTGELRWEQGLADSVERYQENVAGLLSTAGGVLFGGAADLLVALDPESGRRLWTFRAGNGVHAGPITYLVNGRQQITIAVGRSLLTFGL